MKGMFTSLTLVAVAAVGLAADKPLAWPQFRGPDGSGVAPTTRSRPSSSARTRT